MAFIDSKEKGRGIITNEDIKKGDFVVEYKYNESYAKKLRPEKEQEYIINNEGCYILDVQLPSDKGWICLDATRNVHSWGRYMNHSATPNLKMQPAVMIRGKWRVGFTALFDIKKGEELLYDYGRQKDPPDWMKRKVVQLAIKCMLILPLTLPGQTETKQAKLI